MPLWIEAYDAHFCSREIVLIAPGARALGLVWLIAAYSIGISFVALAFRLKNHGHAAARSTVRAELDAAFHP